MKGRYCSHFHLSSTCPECKMIGNAYENAIQSSVTIHGTHHSLVDNNVMWNSRYGSSNKTFCREQSNVRRLWRFLCSVSPLRTVCVYLEDGNEMNNTISENVGICNRDDSCGAAGKILTNTSLK